MFPFCWAQGGRWSHTSKSSVPKPYEHNKHQKLVSKPTQAQALQHSLKKETTLIETDLQAYAYQPPDITFSKASFKYGVRTHYNLGIKTHYKIGDSELTNQKGAFDAVSK